MNYRKDEPMEEAMTQTVTDWQAFRAGFGGVLLIPAVLLANLLVGFWVVVIVGSLDGVRYIGFRAVELGHQRLEVNSDRRFTSRLQTIYDNVCSEVIDKARLRSFVGGAWFFVSTVSIVVWSSLLTHVIMFAIWGSMSKHLAGMDFCLGALAGLIAAVAAVIVLEND